MYQKDSGLKCDFTKSHKSNQVSIYELQHVPIPQYTNFKSIQNFKGKNFSFTLKYWNDIISRTLLGWSLCLDKVSFPKFTISYKRVVWNLFDNLNIVISFIILFWNHRFFSVYFEVIHLQHIIILIYIQFLSW